MAENLSGHAYWDLKKDAFPFHASSPRGEPRPTDVPESVFGAFLAVPFPGLDRTWWGFGANEARNTFIKSYRDAYAL